MARERKRNKQRRSRGGAADRSHQPGSPAPADGDSLNRSDLPGALEHASADSDEFDAALIAGAGGVPVEQDAEPEPQEPAELNGADRGGDELQESGALLAGSRPEAVSGAPVRSGNRAIGFLRASWAELQRVQWPDRRQVTQATAVVIGFVAIAGAYLGLADYVAKEIVEFIL